ncbi:MAG: DUF58 domain-containing protein [Firmicutes bacterium]|nr:DUF58 domain-containing protein [Bacillota bacterium]
MIPVPKTRLIIIFMIPLPLYIVGYRFSALFYWALGWNIFSLVLALWDILATLPDLKYEIGAAKLKPFSIGRSNQMLINFRNKSRTGRRIFFKLDLPPEIEDRTETKAVEIRGLAEETLVFILRPTRRGAFPVKHLYLRVESKYRLFYCDLKSELNLTVEVYPDLKQLNHYLKLAKNNRDYKMGINKTRWMGAGSELESLREYQKDDDSKLIDWKASARLNRPISKVYQMETNNQITVAVDCGRLMTAERQGLNTLDHAVNSLLILSQLVFNVGDSLSIIAFADRIIGEISQLKGRDSLKKVTPFITKLRPEFVESNYKLLFDYLEQTQKKRALIVLLTDMLDDINYELFKKRINWLSRKHFVLLVLLQDSLLPWHAEAGPNTPENLYLKAAGREMLLNRNKAIAKLKHYKLNVLDVLPQELTGPLINKYLEIKTRNRL